MSVVWWISAAAEILMVQGVGVAIGALSHFLEDMIALHICRRYWYILVAGTTSAVCS